MIKIKKNKWYDVDYINIIGVQNILCNSKCYIIQTAL